MRFENSFAKTGGVQIIRLRAQPPQHCIQLRIILSLAADAISGALTPYDSTAAAHPGAGGPTGVSKRYGLFVRPSAYVPVAAASTLSQHTSLLYGIHA